MQSPAKHSPMFHGYISLSESAGSVILTGTLMIFTPVSEYVTFVSWFDFEEVGSSILDIRESENRKSLSAGSRQIPQSDIVMVKRQKNLSRCNSLRGPYFITHFAQDSAP